MKRVISLGLAALLAVSLLFSLSSCLKPSWVDEVTTAVPAVLPGETTRHSASDDPADPDDPAVTEPEPVDPGEPDAGDLDATAEELAARWAGTYVCGDNKIVVTQKEDNPLYINVKLSGAGLPGLTLGMTVGQGTVTLTDEAFGVTVLKNGTTLAVTATEDKIKAYTGNYTKQG